MYPTGPIETEIEEIREDYVRIRTTIKDENNRVLATGTASETNKGNNKINQTSMIENCETSSVGRALGFAGFGVDTAIASAEDVARNKEKNKQFEIYNNMFIRDEEAKYIFKVVIGELMRKMGVVKAGLQKRVEDELWTNLEDMTTHQLQKLESRLRTLNMENNPWHDLYGENQKIKDIVPEGQEVVCESPWYRLGKIALEQAGTDDLLRNEIINTYIDMGITLEV